MDSKKNRKSLSQGIQNLGLILVLIAGLYGAIFRASTANASSFETASQVGLSPGSEAVVFWNAIALQSAQIATPNPVLHVLYLVQVQTAVYNAVIAIKGGFQPYRSGLEHQSGASVEAAVASAAHDMLVYLFPGQMDTLNGKYADFLAGIPEGQVKADGIEVGQMAADEVIALRQGDGWGADIGFTMPAPAPGVWQLPAGATPVLPWVSKLKPCTLNSPDQFRPGPPSDLSSTEWAVEYEEVRLYGGIDSAYRTPEQTDVARFWTASGPVQYNTVFQQVTNEKGLKVEDAARLFGMGNMIGADAVIGCFDAKYHYLFWHPQFAIPSGEVDGNPATVGDPTWKPLLPTPGFPEYVSAHSCFTSATAEVLVAFLGTQKIDIDVTSTVPNLVQPKRHFTYAKDLVQEIIDARVWGGIHYRESDIKGAILGRKVAQWTLQRYFLPCNEQKI